MSTGYLVSADSNDTVGAHEELVEVRGEWHPAEPDIGILRPYFVHTDIVNEHGVSVEDLIEDEDWIVETVNRISTENR